MNNSETVNVVVYNSHLEKNAYDFWSNNPEYFLYFFISVGVVFAVTFIWHVLYSKSK